MSSRLIVPFDFCPNDTVAISGSSYTVPAGKYGLFQLGHVERYEDLANNLASGTVNAMPMIRINSETIPSRITFTVRANSTSSTARLYTVPCPEQAFRISSVRLDLQHQGGGTTAISAVNYVDINLRRGTLGAVSVALRASGTQVSGEANVTSTTLFQSGAPIDGIVINYAAQNTTTTRGVYCFSLSADRPIDDIWLRAGDVLDSANTGTLYALATIYNLAS
jgi:hypothetical protein